MGTDLVMDGMTLTLLRPEDMLVLEFGFVNLLRTGTATGGTVLIPTDASSPAFIEVTFPPQAVLEQVLRSIDAPFGAGVGAGARFSGPTRLAFELPPGTSIPFTVDGLLGWTGLVSAPDRTSIECVWDLTFSAVSLVAAWTHATAPVTTRAGVTELWHTRLTSPDGAVRLGEARSGGHPPPFPGSLDDRDRANIAAAAAVQPVLARELALSAQGATIDLVGDWAGLSGLDLLGYRHRAVLGRDERVSTIERGYLLPFGFAVQLATDTRRTLRSDRATLVQTEHLTVVVPEISYDGAVGLPSEGRGLPFGRLRLDGPLSAEVSTAESLGPGVFWVNTPAGQRLDFTFTAVDREGHTLSFRAPAIFVAHTRAFDDLGPVVARYDDERRPAPVAAAGRVSLAPEVGGGRTAVDVTAVHIGARPADAGAAPLRSNGQLAAFPRLVGVEAHVPALEAFAPGSRAPATLLLDERYIETGLTGAGAPAGGIYARLKDQVPFAPPVTSAGGLAALSLPVSGLSSTAGLVGGELEAFRNGQFDPATFFDGGPDLESLLPPMLLGFIPLADLVGSATAGDGEATPRIVTELQHPGDDHSQPPEAVRSTVTWRPKLKAGLHAGTLRIPPRTATGSTASLDLRSTTLVHLGGGLPTSEVRGELRSFSLEFAGGILIVTFERLAFTSRPGAPPALDVKVADVAFGGDLRFLDALRPYLPSPPNGPRVTVTRTGIEASHTLAIPTLSTGVFMLQNLALSASVTIPFDGTAVRARFAVSSRDDPFLVTVSLFGGGGFIALEVVSGKIETLEAQIEFGAATSLNLGIASASVAVTAGVYIRLGDTGAELKGFFRAVGELDVLGLVNVSVELYIALGYRAVLKNPNDDPNDPDSPRRSEAYGTASLTVRVRVLFFSESVTLTIERSFGGGDDPTFDQAFPTPDPWRQRCAAFAPMGEP